MQNNDFVSSHFVQKLCRSEVESESDFEFNNNVIFFCSANESVNVNVNVIATKKNEKCRLFALRAKVL